MFTLAVSDHIMIAHSFRGVIFGPAQRLHGATYAVEAALMRAELDGDGLIADIGAFAKLLRSVLDEIDFRNLDDEERFKGRNTTTEFLARDIHARIAARLKQGVLGPAVAFASLRVTLRESPVAWAAYEGKP
jgi:6-pyruvoyl-tetrahydropterin synthase